MLKAKKGQNLIEVVLIMPLLIVIMLGILEYSIFQRNVNAVQDIAEEAATAASKRFVNENTGPFTGAYTATENPAVEAALALANARSRAIVPENINLTYHNLGPAFGQRPFALYEFNSTQTTSYKGTTVPVITLTVDYRDPMADGVSTQLIYHYNLILFGIEFSIPGVNGGRAITIIPRSIQISSTQTRQYVHY